MVSETIQCSASGMFSVKNDRGLHTRPCTEIVKCASRFKSEIFITHRKLEVNAKSMLGLLMLAAPRRGRIKIHAVGPDAALAVDALLDLAHKSFNIKY